MTPDDYHDFFVASAGVAGALIGLLFVAVSVSRERLSDAAESAVNRVRASAALTSFTNALLVSLFGLLPGDSVLGGAATTVAVLGLLFVAGSLLTLLRAHRLRWRHARDITFLAGMIVAFGVQLAAGLHNAHAHGQARSLNTIATLVVVFFLFGVSRAWELIGAPTIGLRTELFKMVTADPADPAGTDSPQDGQGSAGPSAGGSAGG